MLFFDLGHLPGQQSMLVFHALARMGIEALVVVSPSSPLVSIGWFQDAEKEVDLGYCRRAGIPFMRREVGGGATYLDGDQVFYQLIWKKGARGFPSRIDEIFRWFSRAPVETYRAFGVKASHRPVNDIVTEEGRKIAGEGGGDVAGCMVFVGGILLDFDYRAMSRVLKVPDEKFRDKVYRTMEENLTTMRRELGEPPPRGEVVRVLRERFEALVGKLEPASLSAGLVREMEGLERRMTSREFLLGGKKKPPSGVKIREGVELRSGLHKAPGGLVRADEEIREGRIEDLALSGDFTMIPRRRLPSMQRSLRGLPLDEGELMRVLGEFYRKRKVESPGVEPADIKEAILKPIR